MPNVSLASHATTRRHESCTDPPARVTNNRRDQAIRPPYYGDHFFSRPRCSYLMLGGASRHDRRVGHAATRWDVQTATRADSIRRWGKPPRGPTQFIWPVVARHDLDQLVSPTHFCNHVGVWAILFTVHEVVVNSTPRGGRLFPWTPFAKRSISCGLPRMMQETVFP